MYLNLFPHNFVIYFDLILNSFRMKHFLDYSYPYRDRSIKKLRYRNLQYDRRSQHISIACSPRLGHHVPFLVKLPSFTTWFSRLPDSIYYDKYWGGSPGVFNSLYYFPDGKEQNEMTVPDVIPKGILISPLVDLIKDDLLNYVDEASPAISVNLVYVPFIHCHRQGLLCKFNSDMLLMLFNFRKTRIGCLD